MQTAMQTLQRRLHTVKEVQTALSVSHATAWRLIASGALKTVRIGRRRLVTDESLEAVATAGVLKVGEAA